jgi:RHS repeat-associated protein
MAGALHPVVLPTITIKEPGILFVYLSYDNDTGGDVFFACLPKLFNHRNFSVGGKRRQDDLKITYQESPVIQINDYYPYGLPSFVWLREGEVENKYQFQGMELDEKTGWYDFHARQYDPATGRWFANDPKGALMPYMSNYAAMMGNPAFFIDPDGELPIIVPIIIGAVAGGYSGYKIGEAKGASGWNMFGYITGGAIIGGVSGYMGGTIAASGGAFSNTISIAYASTYNSMGMHALSGGMTPVVTSFGGFSYDWTNNEWGYLGERGNRGIQNIGYAFGALANLQDIVAGFNGQNIEVGASNTELDKGTRVPHSYIKDASTDDFYVSVANELDVPGDTWGEWIKNALTLKNKWGAEYWTPKSTVGDWKVPIHNVNGKLLKLMQTNIKGGERLLGGGVLRWGGFAGCVNQSGRALWYVGIPTLPINLLPSWLNTQLALRQIGIWSSPYFINNNGY